MPTNTELNPLLEVNFRIPFDRIRAEHVEPAMKKLLAMLTPEPTPLGNACAPGKM